MYTNLCIVMLNEETDIPTALFAKRVFVTWNNGVHHHYDRLSNSIHQGGQHGLVVKRLPGNQEVGGLNPSTAM